MLPSHDRDLCQTCGRILKIDPPKAPRTPCPGCGGMNRAMSAYAHEHVSVHAHLASVGARGGETTSFAESPRPDGGWAEAEVEGEDVSFSTQGIALNNENGADACCRRLLALFDPSAADRLVRIEQDVDDYRVPNTTWRFQVTRATNNPRHYIDVKAGTRVRTTLRDLAGQAAHAIQEKKKHYGDPSGVVLALDASAFPGSALGGVVANMHSRHADVLTSAPFRAVYLVGPSRELILHLAGERLGPAG